MSDLKRYIKERKQRDQTFVLNYDQGYGDFKIGVLLRQAQEAAGLSQEELAKRLKTQ